MTVRRCAPLASLLALVACSSSSADAPAPADALRSVPTRLVHVRFAPVVGAEPFRCGATYAGIGKGKSTIQPLDFRMYVHDVALVDGNGASHPLALEQDGKWQRGSVALLDFVDDEGLCSTGNPETHAEVTGRVAGGAGGAGGDEAYVGLRFVVGVPAPLDHLDVASASPPLDVPGLYWSWEGGYKYVALDVKSARNVAYFLHLGASDCARSDAGDYGCRSANLASVVLPSFRPDVDRVAIDLAAAYAGVDLDAQVDRKTDFVPGCMGEATDPECPALLAPWGLPFPDPAAAAPVQSVFSARGPRD